MPAQYTPSNPGRRERRERLMEIVNRLGRDATGAQIREEAYRTGFGDVNPNMLVAVRNALWPDRAKRSRPDPRSLLSPAVLALATCPHCGSTRTRIRNRHKTKRRHICHDCGRAYRTESSVPMLTKRDTATAIALAATEKKCSQCELVRPVSAFGKVARSQLYRSACRECLNLARAKHQFEALLASHGITKADYDAVFARQGGRCAICRSSGKMARGKHRLHRPLYLDHCHATGKFRGLLCEQCNLAIGNFHDDVRRLEAAIAYLRSHTEARDG